MRSLNVDMSGLRRAVEKIGAETVSFEIGRARPEIPHIDIALSTSGVEISVDEVSKEHGLLSYEGRQVLLYIQDHGGNIDAALEDGERGKKFHVADCRTLWEMRKKGRYDRYVVTNRLDGEFFISGFDWQTGEERDGWTRLFVCKNCLKQLNYQGARSGGLQELARSFDIEEFFSTYSSFFFHMPTRQAGDRTSDGYSEDWAKLAGRYKADRDFRCESCRVDLTKDKKLLHVHHKNGVKGDNRRQNLMALCAACHRQQADHGHMFVPHKTMKTINRLRQEQGLLQTSGWDEAFELCDPALHGVLYASQEKGEPVPEIGYDVKNDRDEVVANLEIAWPARWIGVAIAHEDRYASEKAGWRVTTMAEALDC